MDVFLLTAELPIHILLIFLVLAAEQQSVFTWLIVQALCKTNFSEYLPHLLHSRSVNGTLAKSLKDWSTCLLQKLTNFTASLLSALLLLQT